MKAAQLKLSRGWKIKGNEESKQNPRDTVRWTNTNNFGVLEGKEKYRRRKNVWRNNTKNFPNLVKEI